MIVKFKIFESVNEGEPEIGDWVITNNKRIAKLVNIIPYKTINDKKGYEYKVQFFLKYGNPTFTFNKEHIKFWSKNKEDLEIVLTAKNYNL